MKKVLFTGGTGFLGRNILPYLKTIYDVYAPTRKELDLYNYDSVKQFIFENDFDVIIHSAIPNLLPGKFDNRETLFKDSLKTFLNLYNLREHCGKMIYFGSGAEFDKEHDIHNVKEIDFGKRIPESDYGMAKFIMNTLALQSDNIINLRIFGCFGPTDANFKFITYCIRQCLANESIIINQNCIFDYIHVSDLFPILTYFIEHQSKYHDYNIASGRNFELKKLAQYIADIMGNQKEVLVKKPGLNKEYTASNDRLLQEIKGLKFLSIDDALCSQIEYERKRMADEKEGC